MVMLVWVGVALLLLELVGGSGRTCHPGCHCEVETFGLFDSFSLTRVDCSGLGLGLEGGAWPIPIPLETAHLDLSSNGISSLSAAMLSGPGYTTLVSLDLSSNRVSAAAPDAFSRLRYLETLDLSQNALEALADGCFAGLPLAEVDLSGNRLAELRLGVFSARGQGSRPLSVDASGNRLTAVTRGPSAGGGAPELQSLTLAGNRLSAVPDALRGVGLRYLNLDGNPIAEIPDGAFAGLGELVHLSLAGLGHLTSVRAGAFRGLRNLQVLDLSDSPGLTQLDPEVFGGLDSLQELSLSRSGVATLPAGVLTYLPSLRTVTLGADVRCWKTQKQGQFHRQLGQAEAGQVLTCNMAHVFL